MLFGLALLVTFALSAPHTRKASAASVGTVTDPSGAVVANAHGTGDPTGKGFSRTHYDNADGYYVARLR